MIFQMTKKLGLMSIKNYFITSIDLKTYLLVEGPEHIILLL